MTRNDLKESLGHKMKHMNHLSPADVQFAADVVLDTVIDGLNSGKGLEIRGFGSLRLRERVARVARNPRTGERKYAPKRYSVLFVPSKSMKARVNT